MKRGRERKGEEEIRGGVADVDGYDKQAGALCYETVCARCNHGHQSIGGSRCGNEVLDPEPEPEPEP